MEAEAGIHIRLAGAGDDDFILDLAERFVDFELPAWRRRGETASGIRRDLRKHLIEPSAGSHMFVAEDNKGERVGFVHLQTVIDMLTGATNCHISDLACARGQDGRGIGSTLLAFAEGWARERHCRFITLNVFPGNARARRLYERRGFGEELVRLAKPVR